MPPDDRVVTPDAAVAAYEKAGSWAGRLFLGTAQDGVA